MTNLPLKKKELFFLFLMALPTFGIALAYTLIGVYLPIFIERISNASVTGMMIGSEGFFALIVPTFVGEWSDAIQSPVGKRFPFIFSAVVMISLALFFMPFSSYSITLLWIEIALFFSGYFTYYAAYYALYSDLVPKSETGRSQGVQASFRAVGMLTAMGAGGFLISKWEPLPFVIAIAIISLTTLLLYKGIRERLAHSSQVNVSMKIHWLGIFTLLHNDKNIRNWFYANSLWEAGVSILKAFIVLYFMKALGLTLKQSSMALVLVGVSTLVAAPISGVLADRFGYKKIVFLSALLFGFGLLPPLFTLNPYWLLGIIPVAFVAGTLMTLPFGLIMKLLPADKHHGIGGALFNISQGIGAFLGPFLAGHIVYFTKDWDFLVFKASEGYSGIFFAASAFLLLSLPFLGRVFKTSVEV
jgi:MFS family permease